MSRPVDYYFSVISPWAYLGHAEFLRVAAQHQAPINFKPIALGKLFPDSGGLPLAKRHPLRQAYRLVELQRWRERRNIPLILKPKFFPFDPDLVDRTVIAAAERHPDQVGALIALAFRAVWVEEQNMAEEGNICAILTSLELPTDDLIAAAQSDATRDAYAKNIADALAAGVIGSPSYVIDGEAFWGQDRLDMVGEMLASGRGAYRA